MLLYVTILYIAKHEKRKREVPACIYNVDIIYIM